MAPPPHRPSVLQGAFLGNRPNLRLPHPHQAGAQTGAVQLSPARGPAVQLPPQVLTLRSGGAGQRLPDTVQLKMEALFGADFSGIRVHVGQEAAAIGALAFTHGSDLYFAHGQYSPHSVHGQRLLAHELTHVVQQQSGRVRNPFGSGIAVVLDPGLEAEAERMALRAAAPGRPAPACQPSARSAPSAPAAPAARTPQAGGGAAVQPIGLWLIRKYLNWQRRNELLAREAEVKNYYASLGRSLKARSDVRDLGEQLAGIDASTVAEGEYQSTLLDLNRIERELKSEELAAGHFHQHGRPLFRSLDTFYSGGIDQEAWESLTAIGLRELPKVKKKARQGNPKALVSVAEYLFRRFINAGFGYNIDQGSAGALIGSLRDRNSPEGNCIAYARGFADILNSYGIEAYVKMVREDEQGRFIVKVDSFIDPSVRGHIYEKGQLKAGYYVFSSHAATWVPIAGKYYDPMSKLSYVSLAPYIDCELTSDKNQQVFHPKQRPKTLLTGYKWKLIMKAAVVPGGFHRINLVPA
jgi:hypothetical protein